MAPCPHRGHGDAARAILTRLWKVGWPGSGSQWHGLGQYFVADPCLERLSGHDVDVNAEQLGQFPFQPGKSDKPHTFVEIYQQIDIA